MDDVLISLATPSPLTGLCRLQMLHCLNGKRFRATMNAKRAIAHLTKNIGRGNRICAPWPRFPTSILPMLEEPPSWVTRHTVSSGQWEGRGISNGRAWGNLRYLPGDHGWRRVGNMDPLGLALQVAGHVPSEPYAFRMVGAD